MCIISTIMESCPSTSSFYSTAAAKTQHNGMNNIIRLFLKKGLVNDLARVPHSLDLSRYVYIFLFHLIFTLQKEQMTLQKMVSGFSLSQIFLIVECDKHSCAQIFMPYRSIV